MNIVGLSLLVSIVMFLFLFVLDFLFATKEKIKAKVIAKKFIPLTVELLPITEEPLSSCSSISEKFEITVLVEGSRHNISVSRKIFGRLHLEDPVQVTCLKGFIFLRILSV